jgi:hypothetical protein
MKDMDKVLVYHKSRGISDAVSELCLGDVDIVACYVSAGGVQGAILQDDKAAAGIDNTVRQKLNRNLRRRIGAFLQ